MSSTAAKAGNWTTSHRDNTVAGGYRARVNAALVHIHTAYEYTDQEKQTVSTRGEVFSALRYYITTAFIVR